MSCPNKYSFLEWRGSSDEGWNSVTNWFEVFDKRKVIYCYLVAAFYFFINAAINTSTVWIEFNRQGNTNVGLWEPITWEFSSAMSSLCLLPLLVYWFGKMPLKLERPGRQAVLHLMASIVFSLLHVTLMVLIRELVYALEGGNYDFGPIFREFWYEYQKDALGYVNFLVIYTMLRFIYRRLKGEADFLDPSESSNETNHNTVDHLLVKKLDKEFLLNIADIEWLEAAGNYVNLHSQGRIYPLRSTMKALLERIENRGFRQTHRSYGINLNFIHSIQYLPSGDGEIELKTGAKLSLSRRYKDSFKQSLA